MRSISAVVFLLLLSNIIIAQDNSRERKFDRIKDLNAEVNKLAEELLLPDSVDIKDAESQGLKTFRLMPREVSSRPMTVPQGGGAFYSFTTGSHDYQKTAQILLEENRLRTGFAGANYGLMADLGDISLADITSAIPEVGFLLKYKAPTNILEARAEQRKRGEYKVGDLIFRSYFPAVIGHSYLLRAIDFGDADVFVALKVIRKDTDGSFIIYWKQIANFGKAILDPTIREN